MELNLDNIRGYAVFKYKGTPTDSDLSKIINLHKVISERKKQKTITLFDYEGNADTIVLDENGLWDCNDENIKISNTEEVLGYLVAYISNFNEIFIIVREYDEYEKSSILYGFQIVDNKIFSINSNILRRLNENSLNTCGLNPEFNISFIEIKF